MSHIFVRVTFDDGNFIDTRINTDLQGAKDYYLGQAFELDELKPLSTAVDVKEIFNSKER